jgi:hypothetical protein
VIGTSTWIGPIHKVSTTEGMFGKIAGSVKCPIDNTGHYQVLEHLIILGPIDQAIAIAVVGITGRTAGQVLITGIDTVFIVKGVEGGPHLVGRLDHPLDLGILDHGLPLEHTADQQSNNHQNDGDLHQRKTFLIPCHYNPSMFNSQLQQAQRLTSAACSTGYSYIVGRYASAL